MSETWFDLLIAMIALAGSGLVMAGVAVIMRHRARPVPIPVRARYRRTPPR